MTSSDQRLDELLGRWVRSLELHLRYSALTDEAYWQVQPWPKHSRPARWIIEHALASAKDLQRIVQQRRQQGDEHFASALELMGFLANLVGIQNIERFIPLADPERENREVAGQTASTLQPLAASSTQLQPAVESTREMPAPEARYADLDDPRARPALQRPAGDTSTIAAPYRIEDTRVDAARPTVAAPPAAAPTAATAKSGRHPAIGAKVKAPAEAASDATAEMGPHPTLPSVKPTARAPAKTPPARAPAAKATTEGRRAAPRREPRSARPVPDAVAKIVIADAVRLRKWGREWHELAESISRMAGRPNLTEVRRILRVHKGDIDEDAGHGESGKHRRR